ncbi:MAG TPA: ABC transporter permease [Thermoanaerobaculia bacterium]|nr:ABC transporter permease [Thermoanaerobaculia bacterium]
MSQRLSLRRAAPFVSIPLFVLVWHASVKVHPGTLIPSPSAVVAGIFELFHRGLLFRYIVASLFRVTWGYLLAVGLAVPAGVWLGLTPRALAAAGPLLQILRPISALAWIPVAILWFGVGDLSAIFLIFIASFLPMIAVTMQAVRQVDPVYLHAGRNFGLGRNAMVRRVVIPAVLPRLLVGLRITLGVSWLVVVAAEMIAVNSGLGFLIIDARNAGNRYDLVIAGMVMVGLTGLGLDLAMRRLEHLPAVRWGYVR